MLKPVIDVVFSHGKKPRELADAKVAEAREKLALTNLEVAKVGGELAAAPPEKKRALQAEHDRLVKRRAHEIDKLEVAIWVRPFVYRYLPNDTFLALVLFLSFFIVATLLKDAMLVANHVLVERLTQLAMLDLRNRMFRKTLQMEMAHFGEGHSSHIMHRISGDVQCAFGGEICRASVLHLSFREGQRAASGAGSTTSKSARRTLPSLTHSMSPP